MTDVFRKKTMEEITATDSVESMLVVTKPMSWIGILAAAIIAVAVIIWSVYGTIPTTTSVQGMLVNGYDTNTIYSSTGGTVSKILVKKGDTVKENMPVARVVDIKGKTVDIISNQNGIVTSILASKNDEIKPNMEVIRIGPKISSDLAVVCYVPLDTAKNLKKGMEANVYIDAIDSNHFGHMKAKITNVDNYVASRNAMNIILGNDGQMTDVITKNGPVTAVTCELITDCNTKSGFYFTNDNAKDLSVECGELLTVQIILDETSPIKKVFPILGE